MSLAGMQNDWLDRYLAPSDRETIAKGAPSVSRAADLSSGSPLAVFFNALSHAKRSNLADQR